MSGDVTAVIGARFEQCSTGISGGSPNSQLLSGNTFAGCNNGIIEYPLAALIITGNTFVNNDPGTNGYPDIQVIPSGNTPDFTITGNAFTRQTTNPQVTVAGSIGSLNISGNQTTGDRPANFDLGGAILTKNSTLAAQPTCRYRLFSFINYNQAYGLRVAKGATLTLKTGTVLHGLQSNTIDTGLNIDGALVASGATLTALQDLSPYGGEDTAGLSDWIGVHYADGLTANLQGITIKHARYGVLGDSANLTGCNFLNNFYGVASGLGGGVYRNCNFVGNNLAVQNSSTNDIDARGNWWGDVTGPYNANNNPGGLGNPVSDHVIVGSQPPAIVSLSPNTAVAGSGSVAVTITGTGFLSASQVTWNGTTALTPTYVNTTTLKVTVPANLLLTPGTATLAVVNPALGGGASRGAAFTIVGTPQLALTTVSATRSNGSVIVRYTLGNVGAAAATGVTTSSARTLGTGGTSVTAITGPFTIAPGSSVSGTLTFPAALTPGSHVFQLYGSVGNTSFSLSKTVTVP